MTLVYISIGSNLLSPLTQVNTAISALNQIPKSRILAVSNYYRTAPLGLKDQPNYLNTAVALETDLDMYTLLDTTQRIELQQGRKRKINQHWGPRTIDLDLMLFGNKVVNTKRLTIPHYDMHNRDFMLWPLAEIAPKLLFPDGKALKDILVHLNTKKPSIW